MQVTGTRCMTGTLGTSMVPGKDHAFQYRSSAVPLLRLLGRPGAWDPGAGGMCRKPRQGGALSEMECRECLPVPKGR